MGATLRCVLAQEVGNWQEISLLNVDSKDIRQAYLAAIAWSDQLAAQLGIS
jgi:hypothetical protein